MQKDQATTTQAPLVSVIIVTWNKETEVIRLLEQLKEINYPGRNYDVVVVDNNSSDNTAQAIKNHYPWVILIRNHQNLGGAGGFNTGMRWALQNRPQNRYLWLLDNDVQVDRNALGELVSVMERTPQAAMCGSKVMDVAKPFEIIEAGAFLDYSFGITKSNKPQDDYDAVYQVDYVAACSLLVRTEVVRRLGLLNESLFIYWDDMEWGARFNAAGYKVLASAASVVYHPSWRERTGDSSGIWRRYYRTRNRLWFFNNYSRGIRRRLLLGCIVLDSMMFALANCVGCDFITSRSIISGIQDFLGGTYGKRNFHVPAHNVNKHMANRMVKRVCVFSRHGQSGANEEKFVRGLMKKYPDIKVISVVPDESSYAWASLCGKNNIISYRKLRDLSLSCTDKFRVFRFLWFRSWHLLLTPVPSYWLGGLFGREVAIVDFSKGVAVSIEKIRFKEFLRIPFTATSFLIQVLLFPPARAKLHLSLNSL
jgi:GT2 family glycosyltransferase